MNADVTNRKTYSMLKRVKQHVSIVSKIGNGFGSQPGHGLSCMAGMVDTMKLPAETTIALRTKIDVKRPSRLA
jgi:hypothetical protein